MPSLRNLLLSRWLRRALCCLTACLYAADHRGAVMFNGLPVPGARILFAQSGKSRHTVADIQGRYIFHDVGTAPFTVEVEMNLFTKQRKEFATSSEEANWVLTLLPREQIAAKVVPKISEKSAFQRAGVTASPVAQAPASDPAAAAQLAQQAADGFLISGSVHNAATTPFAQMPAFGNNRRSQRSLYNGNLGMILNNALFDARAYSLTGQNTLKPDYSRFQGLFSVGGPIRIPGLLRRGPVFSVNYQWTRNRNATTQTGLMPTARERAGLLEAPVIDPSTGAPFPENRIPAGRISPQARALLRLYPEPNFSGSTRYNFQLPIVSGLHQDDLQSRLNKQVHRNFFSGAFSLKSARTDTPDLFGFLDTGSVLGWNATAGYRRMIDARSFVNFSVNINRLTTRVTPYFADRENVSGEAGIEGNNQESINWGPPNLNFTGGISPLVSAQASLIRNQTASVSGDYFFSRNGHNIAAGYTMRRQQFNVLSQQDARGTFAFTGATAGNDFAGFLLGIPDTSAIAFGNPDKYLRGLVQEAFLNDDWRVNHGLTINAGVRWEYWSPVSEKYGRLVNLDIASGASNSTLPRPDRNNIAPRVAFSWRPLPASSLVVRGGYGIYYDTSIYQPIAMEMAQQAPLSKSLRAANSALTPLTLAKGFPTQTAASPTTFGVDPDFRAGYAQTWRVSVQSDLPGGMQASANYLGSKGTRGQQQFLPNTFPGGPIQPFGFAYLVSNGNSSRHAGEVQLRRRLRKGLTAQVQYTWSKSLDNALSGGRGRPLIAQNWLDLSAERGRSSLDQRHLVTGSFQYTTGLGLNGRAARFLREWTIGSQITLGSGLPLTPLSPFAIPGTGYTGIVRPDYTGAPLYDAPAGLYLNPAAVRAAASGAWGNAGRNSISGPRQFVINSSLGRTLRSWDRFSLDLRVDATNSTNTPTFPAWNVVAGHAQFGLPVSSNPMRAMQITIRMGF